MEVPMAKLLSGKEVTASLNEEIRKKVETLNAHQITQIGRASCRERVYVLV